MKKIRFLLFAVVLCSSAVYSQSLTLEQANRLIALPLKCADQEYPNKLGQVLDSKEDLKSPQELHPAFYGCFDWHSAVHGHWLMVALLKKYPEIEKAEEARKVLESHLSAENIQKELAFFDTKSNASFERTYGWAWILKLQMELDSWNDPLARSLADNLRPLSDRLCSGYYSFLGKLVYPIRTGEHVNTAFGLTFAYDYALTQRNDSLKLIIEKKSTEFYGNDAKYPLRFEPSGYDFLSPAFEEADLMRRVLSPEEFQTWLKKFLPELYSKKFSLEPGKILDRTDGKLVHLDGLNFSRAWCLIELSRTTPKLKHLEKVAEQHINASIGNIVDGDYMGEHWLASFALLSLLTKQ
jgi:hypothetical protein